MSQTSERAAAMENKHLTPPRVTRLGVYPELETHRCNRPTHLVLHIPPVRRHEYTLQCVSVAMHVVILNHIQILGTNKHYAKK
jgi:hypothetical protein